MRWPPWWPNDVTDTFTLKGDYAQVFGSGHFDPLASYVSQAVASGDTELKITDFTTSFPSLGFEWKVEENLQWDFQAQYIANVDHVSPTIVPEPAFLKANVVFAPQPGTHPFSWNGLRLNSSLRFKF